MPIEVEHLSFSYGSREILHDISLTIPDRTLVNVLGPNGVGKSTLFRCILCLNDSYAGRVLVNGRDLRQMPIRERAKLISYIPQSHSLVYDYEVLDVVLMSTGTDLGLFNNPGKAHASYKEVSDVMAGIPEEERTDVLYLTGDDGLSCLANGSYQANVIDMVADNVAVVDDPSGKSNETDMEQIANWNPQVIIFAPKSAYELAGTDATWQGLTAIETGNYCEVPSEPFNWLNGPPSVNQVLGMQWLARVLYPEMFDDDMYETVAAYYKTMYQYDLSEDEFNEIAKNASLVCEQELAE